MDPGLRAAPACRALLDSRAIERQGAAVDGLPPGGVPLAQPVDALWDAWTPWQAAERLAGVDAPWAVAGGWALDVWIGRQTREHEDLEIAVPAGRFGEVRAALAGYELDVVGGPGDGTGRRWPVDDPAAEVLHQTWVREPATGLYRLDVFREPHDGDVWICRRDPSIRRPYADVVRRTRDGVPYVAPEIVLLFKAKHADRPRDETDLARAASLLAADERAWLRESLARVHPGHAWLERL